MRHWLFVLNFHFSSPSNWRQTLVNSHTYVFAVLISFLFLSPTNYSTRGSRWEGPCSCLRQNFLFSWPCFRRLFPRVGVYRLLRNHLDVAARALWDVCLRCLLWCHFFFLTITVVRQECAITCCWRLLWESPITMGPSAWLQCTVVLCLYVCVCACVLALFWWAAVPSLSGSDCERWLRSQVLTAGRKRQSSLRGTCCVWRCHLGTARHPPPLCSLTSANRCLTS